MEFRDKNRNFKAKEDKEKKENIKKFVNRIKSELIFVDDFAISMINCYVKQDFRPLSINELVSLLKIELNMESDSHKIIRKKVENNISDKNYIFQKKNYKYDLALEQTVKYLTSFLSSRSSSKSGVYKNNINNLTSDKIMIEGINVLNFPEQENDIAYFSQDNENQHKFSASNVEDTCFTFGEQSQIKIYKQNKQDEETLKKLTEKEIKALNKNNISDEEIKELRSKALEKNVSDFNSIFDRNNYFQNLEQEVKEFFKLYQNNNEEKDDFKKLEEDINELYSLIKDKDLKKTSFDELSSLFNEEKEALLLLINMVHTQYKIIKKARLINDAHIPNEKDIIESYIKKFKDLFNMLQDNYEKIKESEKDINEKIYEIKKILKEICDKYIKKEIKNYQNFFQIVKNIADIESIPIKVNINEIVRLCYFYVNEFDNYLIEMKSKNNKMMK